MNHEPINNHALVTLCRSHLLSLLAGFSMLTSCCALQPNDECDVSDETNAPKSDSTTMPEWLLMAKVTWAERKFEWQRRQRSDKILIQFEWTGSFSPGSRGLPEFQDPWLIGTWYSDDLGAPLPPANGND